MKFRSKQSLLSNNSEEQVEREDPAEGHHTLYAKSGFSLVEAVTALIILALISSSVLVVVDRCVTSAADSSSRIQAFEVARENMEALLSRNSVEETVNYGSSDKYPGVQWQTAVETFYEPLTERIWVRGVCSAEYTDTAGDTQTIELTQWLTGLTKEQIIQMIEQKQKDNEWPAEEIIKTIDEAADYAEVDAATIQNWVENGMPLTGEGFYITGWLDLYMETDGEPTVEEKTLLAKEYMVSKGAAGKQNGNNRKNGPESELGESGTDKSASDKSGPEPEVDPDRSTSQLDYPPPDAYGQDYLGSPRCGFVSRSALPNMSLQELYEFVRCIEEDYQ